MTLHTKCRWINPKSKEICTPNRKISDQEYLLQNNFLRFQYTRGDKGRSNERKKTTLGNPTHRVSRRDPGKLKMIDQGHVSLSQ